MYQETCNAKKITKTYTLPLKFLNTEQRKAINLRIKELEKEQYHLLDKKTVQIASDICRKNPYDLYPRSKLSKIIGKSPNIAESAFHWLFASLKSKIDKEKKVHEIFSYFLKNPQQAIEWFIFGRSPYTEIIFSKKWESRYIWVLNLLTSTRRQIDSHWRQKVPEMYRKYNMRFNNLLPRITHHEVELAITDAYENKLNEFAELKKLSANQTAFLNKLHFLEKNKSKTASYITSWINIPQTSQWKSLKELSFELASSLGKASRKLFSTIRLITIFALFPYLWETVSNLLKTAVPEEFVPLPFKRKRNKLPIKLMMNRKYVITRPGNAEVLTDLAIKNGEFDLGFPSKSRLTLVATLIFPQKVRTFLKRGARIKVLQITSGRPPNYKPNIKVILEGESSYFLSSTLTKQYMQKIPLNQYSVIGVDINRLGKHMIAFNFPMKIPDDLLNLSNQYRTLTNNQIRSLHAILAIRGKQKDTKGYYKIRGELKRVYERRARILKEIKKKLPHFLAAVLIRNNCDVLCIEDLQISARGKRGAIAKAIYNMPDDLEIFSKAISIVSEISDKSIKLILVNPWNTSKSHNNCGGILDRTLSNYDYAPCKKCNSKVNTHINAAKNIAQKGREVIKNYNSPSSHVRGSGEIPQEISSD